MNMTHTKHTQTGIQIMTITPISNTFTRDLCIDQQVALGISDWQAEDDSGRVAFGHTEAEARENFAAL